MSYASSYKDLKVYQRQRELAREVFMLTISFPKEERYALTDQFRRSSRSIGGQIAEAWAKRRYENHFISKLTDADAEQQETQHWIGTSLDCAYIDATTAASLESRCMEIGRMLNRMIDCASSFCQDTAVIREEPDEFFIPPATRATDH
jgi:four helix bundle protein